MIDARIRDYKNSKYRSNDYISSCFVVNNCAFTVLHIQLVHRFAAQFLYCPLFHVAIFARAYFPWKLIIFAFIHSHVTLQRLRRFIG